MSEERSFLVTVEAVVRAEVAIAAPSSREAARMALQQGPDSGDLVGAPQRLSARACNVREVTQTAEGAA